MSKPILFTTKMVNAALAGIKTQTRRAVTSANTVDFSVKKKLLDFSDIYSNGSLGVKIKEKDSEALWRGRCKWQPGNLLYVRETWKPKSWSEDGDNWLITYKADGPDFQTQYMFDDEDKEQEFYINLSDELLDKNCPTEGPHFIEPEKYLSWRPSIFLPKNASRIWLNVKDVRVERVQDIKPEEVLKEGVRLPVSADGKPLINVTEKYHIAKYLPDSMDDWTSDEFIIAHFAKLWDSINAKRNGGQYAWHKNPWVWAIDFEMVSTRGTPHSLSQKP